MNTKSVVYTLYTKVAYIIFFVLVVLLYLFLRSKEDCLCIVMRGITSNWAKGFYGEENYVTISMGEVAKKVKFYFNMFHSSQKKNFLLITGAECFK